jgi:hypothetical protein
LPLRPPEISHDAPVTPKRSVPSSTFTKGCDDDDDAATGTDPRVSPGKRRGKGGGPHSMPFRKEEWHPRTSPRWRRPNRQRFLLMILTTPPPDAPLLSTTLFIHHHTPRRPCRHQCHLTVAIGTRRRGTRRTSQKQDATCQQPRWKGPPPPLPANTDRTHRPEQTRPTRPGEPEWAREAPVSVLQYT